LKADPTDEVLRADRIDEVVAVVTRVDPPAGENVRAS
jgi:hypothetical protein